MTSRCDPLTHNRCGGTPESPHMAMSLTHKGFTATVRGVRGVRGFKSLWAGQPEGGNGQAVPSDQALLSFYTYTPSQYSQYSQCLRHRDFSREGLLRAPRTCEGLAADRDPLAGDFRAKAWLAGRKKGRPAPGSRAYYAPDRPKRPGPITLDYGSLPVFPAKQGHFPDLSADLYARDARPAPLSRQIRRSPQRPAQACPDFQPCRVPASAARRTCVAATRPRGAFQPTRGGRHD
jgi:hypothetical protein